MQSHWQLQESTEYRILKRGTISVSDRELLTALIGCEAGVQKLTETFTSLRDMAQTGMREFMQVEGIDKLAALRLVSAFELGRRMSFDDTQSVRLNSSDEVARYIAPKYAGLLHEVFVVLYMNRNHELIAEEQLFVGGINQVTVDTRIIFKKAILCSSSGILLAHNHPSGALTPSQADQEITRKIALTGKLLDIPVLDHVIISPRGHYSFADEGLMSY